MLSACSGAKRGASSIQTMPDGSVIASTSFGSGRRQALSGASRTMAAAVRTLGAEAVPAGAEACALAATAATKRLATAARRRRLAEMGTGVLGNEGSGGEAVGDPSVHLLLE